ncbi:MAG TPA: DUF3592 domain-containing protein [Pirellulales bacterium]|nr:DUF3592 domain-containing protein [Pirellulales bacterium]
MTQVVKRFFGKKRGSRNMRSDKLGGASLGVFFVVFLVLGCVSLAVILSQLTVPNWRANYSFEPTECTVLDTRVAESAGRGRVVYRPEVRIAYMIDGVDHRIWTYDNVAMFIHDEAWCRQAIAAFKPGERRTCWYDPQNPERAIVVRGENWFAWLALVVPLSFLAIGGTGLVLTLLSWGKSTERRAVWARKAAELDPLESIVDVNELFPHVPGHAHLTNSAGTTLRYRLPPASPSWSLWGMLAATVAWNVLVAALVVLDVRRHLAGSGDWALTTILASFVLAGVVLIVGTLRKFAIAAEVGTRILEIDQQPLYPGGRYKLFLSQQCRAPIERCRILLVCDEEVRYLQGTNLRTARQRVVEQVLYCAEKIESETGEAHTALFSFELPSTAMHSFSGSCNHIVWKLIVEGRLRSGREFERAYQLNVYPRAGGRAATTVRAAQSEHA